MPATGSTPRNSVAAACDSYLGDARERRLRAETLCKNTHLIKRLTAPYGSRPLKSITVADAARIPGHMKFQCGHDAQEHRLGGKTAALAAQPGVPLLRRRDEKDPSGLLLAELPVTGVTILLGHANAAIAEQHYAPWVCARQERLEDPVKRTGAP